MSELFVITISSYTGGGKTTLARQLASLLSANLILWDDYDEAGFVTHPKDWRSWLKDGADNNAWKVPQLAKDLAQLKQGRTITSPIDSSKLEPSK